MFYGMAGNLHVAALDIDDCLLKLNTLFLDFLRDIYNLNIPRAGAYFVDVCRQFDLDDRFCYEALGRFYRERPDEPQADPAALAMLSRFADQGIRFPAVTGRAFAWEAVTRYQLESNYGDLIKDVFFTGFHQEPGSRSKADICWQEKIACLVDDMPFFADNCLDNGIPAIILDRPWNAHFRNPYGPTWRAFSFEQIEQMLDYLITSNFNAFFFDRVKKAA